MKWTYLNLLAALVAFGTAGCEVGKCGDPGEQTENTEEVTDEENCTSFKSLEKFTGTPQVNNVPWTAGKKVIVENGNGSINVIQGTVATEVSVTIEPSVMRAHDTPEEDAQASMERLVIDTRNDGDDNVIVSVTREEGANIYLAADVTVEVPEGFDGSLDVSAGNGPIDVNVGTVVDLKVVTENGSVDVTANGVSWFDIRSGNGDITAGFGALTDGSTQTDPILIGTELGDITLSLPADGVFSVQAAADDLVTFDPYPATCTETVAEVNSKTLACGTGGPNIELWANEGVAGEITVGVQ